MRHAGEAAAAARDAAEGADLSHLEGLRGPMFVFLACAMLCMFFSTFCHAFYCVGQEISRVIWRFDYVGIALMVAGSFVPPVAYVFRCSAGWRDFYLGCMFVLAALTAALSLPERFQGPQWRKPRAALFSGLGLFAVFPVMHQLLFYWKEVPPPVVQAMQWEVLMGAFYLAGAGVYAARVPERWKPGWFCYGLHSHNIFHLLVVAAAYVHYHACTLLLSWRSSQTCEVDRLLML